MLQEVEALCGSIFMTHKFDKSVRKMRLSLEEIEESRRVQMAKKVEEKTELEAAGEDIRQVRPLQHSSLYEMVLF